MELKKSFLLELQDQFNDPSFQNYGIGLYEVTSDPSFRNYEINTDVELRQSFL